MLRLGLLINPYAGIGGSVALKGSDGEAVRTLALQRGAKLRAGERTRRAFTVLSTAAPLLKIYCWGGAMGADALQGLGFDVEICGQPSALPSGPQDTAAAAKALAALDLDVLVFAGGDGTARDVCDAVGESVAVLGIPCGVKMHSGVYAVSPEAAGELLLCLASAGLVNLQVREVRDIDEDAFREGAVRSRFYGQMMVPEEGRFLQHTKVSGVESDELVAVDIAADFVERMEADTLYLIGPGSTTMAILEALDLPGTLLGVDAVCAGELLLADASEAQLLELLNQHAGRAEIVVTVIGGQGHVFGRGNQQLSAAVIHAVGPANITIVAGKGKIRGLQGRALLVDSNDPQLDQALCGYRAVRTGYHDAILYPLGVLP